MKTLLQSEDGPDNLLDVLFLVIRGYDNDTIAYVRHFYILLLFLLQSYKIIENNLIAEAIFSLFTIHFSLYFVILHTNS